MQCNQCGRPAIVELSGHPLCVEHWGIVERIEQQRLSTLERQANQAKIDMAHIMGDPISIALALAEREALSQKTTNVNVANSVVGAINTGTVRSLSVKMDYLTNHQPTADVGKALKELTTAVLSAETLAANTKDEAAVQLTFLADQAALAPKQRQKALAGPILGALQTTLSVTADLLAVWNQWGPILVAFFGR